MSTSQERKTDAGKGDADRGDQTKRGQQPFYWKSVCCNAHISMPEGEGGHFCMKCKEPCEVLKP